MTKLKEKNNPLHFKGIIHEGGKPGMNDISYNLSINFNRTILKLITVLKYDKNFINRFGKRP